MEIHTFVAESAADAIAQIREKLGPEAIVLNVRRTPAGGLSRLWQKTRIEVLAHLPEKESLEKIQALSSENISACLAEATDSRPLTYPEQGRSAPAGIAEDEALTQSESFLPANANRWRISALLKESGLLPICADRVLQEVQSRFGDTPPHSIAKEIDLAQGVLGDLWKSKEPKTGPASVHVFVGAPGTGKTTCLCKWLARAVLMEGQAAQVWRLDGHAANTAESLSIYCEILGVPMERFPQIAASSLAGLTLIDLPGINPTDVAALQTVARLTQELGNAQVHLVLNAAYDARLLLKQVRAFSMFPIADLIIAHLDEEHRWGKLWNLVLGTNYSIRFLSAGQNIPGDFLDASAELILARQFCRE